MNRISPEQCFRWFLVPLQSAQKQVAGVIESDRSDIRTTYPIRSGGWSFRCGMSGSAKSIAIPRRGMTWGSREPRPVAARIIGEQAGHENR